MAWCTKQCTPYHVLHIYLLHSFVDEENNVFRDTEISNIVIHVLTGIGTNIYRSSVQLFIANNPTQTFTKSSESELFFPLSHSNTMTPLDAPGKQAF